jgi:peroxiredoxin
MTIIRAAALAFSAFTITAALPLAQDVFAKPMKEAPGIAVGAIVPVAQPLKDSQGKPTAIAKQMGKKGMVLVLVRSAAWCPFCKAQMIGLKDAQAAIAQRGYSLATLSYDAPATLASFGAAKGLGYTMLSDEGSKLIDALRLRDPQYPAGSFAAGVPYPAILVLGPDGKVKAKNISLDYKVRPSNSQILTMVDGVKG